MRTAAIGFLILFHILLTFQAWVDPNTYPQNRDLLEEFVPFVSMLAVWRIPLLFMISGMGVRFAMERRDWKALLKDRTVRILIPYLFGMLIFGPILAVVLPWIGWDAPYTPGFGHLWFLLNIFLYVLWLLGLMLYLKDHPENPFFRFLKAIIRRPFGLLLFAIPLMVEAWATNPEHFGIYIDNVHGWVVGLLCFFMGFLFMSVQEVFWPAVEKIRWVALVLALSLYGVRLFVFDLVNEVHWLTALESLSWMLSIIGFGSRYLNQPSGALAYFSKAVYPVYIVHLPVQKAICYFLLPLSLPAYGKLSLLLIGTYGISLVLYEFFLRRLKWIRPLFGMKLSHA
ncbi:MAG: acyltransferase family protein [Gemmatimonadetes bacterium]|nr:acyltransferase family protein [Gemmatimonadota bacterium]